MRERSIGLLTLALSLMPLADRVEAAGGCFYVREMGPQWGSTQDCLANTGHLLLAFAATIPEDSTTPANCNVTQSEFFDQTGGYIVTPCVPHMSMGPWIAYHSDTPQDQPRACKVGVTTSDLPQRPIT